MRNVLLKDDAICKVKAICKVYIKSHVNTVMILDDIIYVPQLKRNLLSVYILDSASFKNRWGREFITITKGALTLLKDKLSSTLYYLDNSIVIG